MKKYRMITVDTDTDTETEHEAQFVCTYIKFKNYKQVILQANDSYIIIF